MQLDFTKHFKIVTDKYKSIVNATCALKGMNTKRRIMLINAVAAAILAYTMNSLIFPTETLSTLNTWTAKRLKHLIKAKVLGPCVTLQTKFLHVHNRVHNNCELSFLCLWAIGGW